MSKKLSVLWMILFLVLVSFGCSNPNGGDSSIDGDGKDGDEDSDTESDTEADAEADTEPDIEEKTPPAYPLDDLLRVNHLQARGTHNSYHVPLEGIETGLYAYTHEPLDVQLGDQGVRQFELDLHLIEGEGLLVYHLPLIDDSSTCKLFVDCLNTVKEWSDANPMHHPLLMYVEPKDTLDPIKLPGHHPEIEEAILSVWPRERILTPDTVRAAYNTLAEAITTAGWPTLGETRGKLMINVNDSGAFRDSYLAAYPDLKGALMFIDSSPGDSHAAVMTMNGAIRDAEQIRQAVTDGFLVRTMAGGCCGDPIEEVKEEYRSALESGAHFISTDFPAPIEESEYWLEIPEGAPSRCNPVSSPESCRSWDIENLD